MLDFISRLDDMGAWTVAVVGGIAAIGAAARWIYKRSCAVVKWARMQEARLERVDSLVESAEYHSRPNGGGSAYDGLLREVRLGRDETRRVSEGLAAHVEQANSIHDEQAAAIAFLAEALPIVARSVPHPLDAHLPDPGADTAV